MTPAPFIRAFLRGNAHHATLLAALDVESLLVRPRDGARTVGEVFAHLHDARLDWLRSSGASDLTDEIDPLEPGDEESRDTLVAALEASAIAIATFVAARAEEGRGIPGSGSPEAALARWIAHDAHHRGQVVSILADRGHPLPAATAAALWEWR